MDKGKLVAVLSNVAGNGAKYVATNLAHDIKKKHKTSSVLLIDFDFERPFLAQKLTEHDTVHGLDHLFHLTSGGCIEDALFLENLVNTKCKLAVLKGVKSPTKGKVFSRAQIEMVLDKAKTLFDYIYVVVSSDAGNAGTLVALMQAEKVLVVLKNDTGNESVITRTIRLIRQYSTVNIISFIYNGKSRYSKSNVSAQISATDGVILDQLSYVPSTTDNVNLLRSRLFSKSKNSRLFRKVNRFMFGDQKRRKNKERG